MTLQRGLMAAERWDASLDPSTPSRVLDLCTDLARYAFGHVFRFPLHIPLGVLSEADLPAAADFAGILRDVSTSSTAARKAIPIGGPGLAVLLGDEDGKAVTYQNDTTVTTLPLYDGSNPSWIRTHVLRVGTGSNGITAGAIPSSASPTKSGLIKAGDSPRKVLDFACDLFGVEWRINPDGTLDVDTAANLFRSGELLVSPQTGGRDSVLTALQAFPENDADAEDWTQFVRVNDSSAANTASATIGTNPYVGFDGQPLLWRRFISSTQAANATVAANLAAAQLGRFDQIQEAIDVPAIDAVGVLSDVMEPGDTILVHDPDQGFEDVTATQRYNHGEPIFPASVRLVGMTEATVADDEGLALRYWDGAAFRWVDLTPYVVPEPKRLAFDVGAYARTLQDAA